MRNSTDDNGCFDDDCVTILGDPPHQWDSVLVDVKCFGLSTGSINLHNVVVGNGPPYTFVWDPAIAVPSLGDSILTDLAAGYYSVTITDISDIPFIWTYKIEEPTELTTDPEEQ